MPEPFGPAIARDRLLARLRELRESRGLPAAEVARRLAWPEAAVDEVEAGTTLPSPARVAELLGVYEVDGPVAESLLLLARFARTGQWWAGRGLTDEHHEFLSYESEATHISVYQPLVVPGLLQTPRYARAATAAILRKPVDDPDVVARADLRAERQRTVAGRAAAGDAPRIVAMVDEVVLRRPVGGGDVLREQLDHLVTEARQDHVTLVVLPTGIGGHPGLGGVFELLEFRPDDDLALVFIESTASDHFLRGPRAAGLYQQIVADLVAAGRGGDDAVAFVASIRDDMGPARE